MKGNYFCCPFVRVPVNLFVHTDNPFFCLSVHPFVCLFVNPFVRLFVNPFVRLFVNPFVCLFVNPFVRLSVNPFVRLSVFPNRFSDGPPISVMCLSVVVSYYTTHFSLLNWSNQSRDHAANESRSFCNSIQCIYFLHLHEWRKYNTKTRMELYNKVFMYTVTIKYTYHISNKHTLKTF